MIYKHALGKSVHIHYGMSTLKDLHQKWPKPLVGLVLNSVKYLVYLLQYHYFQKYKSCEELLICSRSGNRCCKCAPVVPKGAEIPRFSVQKLYSPSGLG